MSDLEPTVVPRERLFDDPNLLPLLPMVYVAWSDGDFDADEMAAVCKAIRSKARLDQPCDALLARWLDHDDPPSSRELSDLLQTIRARAEGLNRRQRVSLAELGLEIARASDGVSTVERDALVAIEEQMGVLGSEAARQLLASRRPPEPAVHREPTFPIAVLTRWLDGDQRPVRERVRAVLRAPAFAYPESSDREAARAWTLARTRDLAAAGLGALSFRVEDGGERSTAAFVATFETLAHHDLSVVIKYGVQFGLFGGSIWNLGTERHHDQYLRAVGSLDLPGCFAMTETGHGSNVADLETVARFDAERDGFVIHTPHPGARKDYIGNAARDGRMATVFAQLEVGGESHGVHALLVPIRDEDGTPLPGVTIEDCGTKLGLNGVDNGRLTFDQVFVARDHLLDRFASVDAQGRYSSPIANPSKRFFTMLGTLVGGRVAIAHAAVSVAKSALTIAIRYGNRRRQFGPPDRPETALLDYTAHQRRLLPRLATTVALHAAMRELGVRYAASEGDGDRREVEHLAAGLKAAATWHATDTVQACREACGGQGYLAENRFAAMKADSDIFTTFEGDNTVLLQLVAKGLLTGYRKQFHDMNLFGLVRFVARRAGHALVERNPVSARRSDEDHLRHPDFLNEAFGWREDHLVATLAQRLKAKIDRGMDTADALNACQDHLLGAARAHVDRLVMEHATTFAQKAPIEVREIVEWLVSLHGLSRLHAERGWFLEEGYFEGVKTKAIRRQVGALCASLRPHAESIVAAFAIPPEVLAAPIGR